MSIIATDLDGTIFKGQTLIDGVKEGLLKIINKGIEIYYTTNNSSQTPSEIKDKLEYLLQLNIDISKIITPLVIFQNLYSNNKSNIFIYGKKLFTYQNTLPEILKNSETVLLSHSIWNDKILVRMVAKDAYDLKSIQKNLLSILADDNIPKVWNS